MMIFNLRVSIMGLHVSLSYCAKRSWITKRCGIFSIYPSISILHTFLPWSVSRSVYDAHPWDLLSQLSGRFQPNGRYWWEIRERKESETGAFFLQLSPAPLGLCIGRICIPLPEATGPSNNYTYYLWDPVITGSSCPFRPKGDNSSPLFPARVLHHPMRFLSLLKMIPL